jgi:hypothetical protein
MPKVPKLLLLVRFFQFTTVGVVAGAGFVGGLMSLLQRVQSVPAQGDSLFSLASIAHGWRGVFLAHISGAVFAFLLFVMFAGELVQGSIFPKLKSVSNPPVSQTGSPSAPTQEPTPTPAPSPTPGDPISLTQFLIATNPVDAVSYALLVIWFFIAGFAERLVPDTLSKLVVQGDKG